MMQNAEPRPYKPRSEFVRILLFLGISLGVQAVTLLCEFVLCLLCMIVARLLGFEGDVLDVGFYTFVLIFVTVGPGISAACNRCFTFRAKGRWWPGPLLMAGIGILYAFLDHALFLLKVNSTTLPTWGSVLLTWGSLALWLIASYVLQRFVLYRKTLDTLSDTPDEKEDANA